MKQGISLPQIPKKLLDTDKELYDYLFGLQQALLAKQTDDYSAVDKASSDIASFITNNKASQAEAIAGTLDTKIITPHTLREGFNASGDAPIYACRAWVNFDGTGSVAKRASGNVESITDNNTGDYTVNFTTNMPDVNYSVVGSAGGYRLLSIFDLAVGSVRVRPTYHVDTGPEYSDQPYIWIAIFR